MGKPEVKRDMPVKIGERDAVIVFPSLNKVKVRFSDGTEEMVSYQQIKTTICTQKIKS